MSIHNLIGFAPAERLGFQPKIRITAKDANQVLLYYNNIVANNKNEPDSIEK